ncbi:MAG: hypothetical protein IPQ16_07235 [Geobacteraceae bacterium]|nr:hypothetical protein [Geobacteraceae bacterium]
MRGKLLLFDAAPSNRFMHFALPFESPYQPRITAYAGQMTSFKPRLCHAGPAPAFTTIPPLFKGTTSSDVTGEATRMNFTTPTLIVTKSILTLQFIAQPSDY